MGIFRKSSRTPAEGVTTTSYEENVAPPTGKIDKASSEDASSVTSAYSDASSSSSASAATSSWTVVNWWNVVMKYYKAGQLSWPLIIYLAFVHVVAIMGLFAVPYCQSKTLVWAALLWPISGSGINVGAHRLWSHRAYEASLPLRIVLMLFNSIANQRSIYHWCRDHRMHHKYSETTADPHDATRGFFFAHIGWLLVLKHPDVAKLGKTVDFSDLWADPVVRFQEYLDPWFAAYMCFVFPAQVATYFWGESFWYGFLVPGGLRYAYVLHCTFLVNSAAHLYGDHPYDDKIHPSENPFVALFAGGEGWHNFHHKYPFDYATSEFGISSQFNPSKVAIDIFAAMGLAWGRKRATSTWEMARARRDLEREKSAAGQQGEAKKVK